MDISLALRVFVIIAAFVLLAFVIKLVATGRLRLKYSLLWLLFALLALFFAVFPQPVFFFAGLLGFEQPSNFLFFAGGLFALAIILSLTVVVSKHSQYIARLVQENALLKQRVEELEKHADGE